MPRNQRILIVEDEPADSMLLKRVLYRIRPDVEVDIASDGDEALSVLLPANGLNPMPADFPRYVLLDLKLRRMDGLIVLEALKADAHARKIPVIVFTSSSDPSDVRTAYDLGANSYLVKPLDSAGLTGIAGMICTYWLETNHTVNADAR